MYDTKRLELFINVRFLNLHGLHRRMGWALMTPRYKLIHLRRCSLYGGLDIAIPGVSHPAAQAQSKRFFLRALAEEYPLNPALYP
jgi:hypothetical protein